MRCLASVLILALLAVPAAAQPWYARGSFNNWSTDDGVNVGTPFPMVVDPGDSTHYTSTVGAGVFDPDIRYEWKIATENWASNYPNNNSVVYTNTNGGINFHLWDNATWSDGYFPNNSRRVGYDDPGLFDWEIFGSFNSWPDAFDPNYALTDMGNGLHRGTFALNTGIYDFKFRGLSLTPASPGNSDVTIGNNFSNETLNTAATNQIAVTSNGDMWTFELDLPKGRWRAFTNAAPPGQAGDYNDNDIVDAADYTTWRDKVGSTTALPNDGGLGTPIGTAHYNQWKSNFGLSAPTTWLIHNTPLAGQTQIPDTQLNDLGGGQYDLQLTGLTAATDYDFKVVSSDLSESVPGSNMRVRANAAGEIDLKFHELTGATWGDGWSPANAHRVGYADSLEFDWELIGDFTGWGSDPLAAMIDQTNGLHTVDYTFATAGSYQFKFRKVGDWGTSIGPDFGNSAGNNPITIVGANELWRFELDLPNGRWRAYQADLAGAAAGAVPEPGSLAIALAGLLVGAVVRRRR
jgi:hypothetical protein